MGLLSHLVTYRIGKRRGRVAARRSVHPVVLADERDPECIHYLSFCRTFGNCNGGECEYE